MPEDKLQQAILNAINEYYGCGDDIRNILLGNIEAVLTDSDSDELRRTQQRLSEIDKSRNELISLITSGSADEDQLDGEFQKLFKEEQHLLEITEKHKAQSEKIKEMQLQIKEAERTVRNLPSKLTEYDDMIVKKLIECVKVISKTEITVIFKGGYEVTAEVEE